VACMARFHNACVGDHEHTPAAQFPCEFTDARKGSVSKDKAGARDMVEGHEGGHLRMLKPGFCQCQATSMERRL
jgi:hypothetical protein